MTNIKSIQNQMPENVFGLLMEMSKIKGTKEIFESFGLKALDKGIELEMLKTGMANIDKAMLTEKFCLEFAQLKTMFDGQITIYQTMANTAEGFMKQMADMQLQTAKNSLDMSVQNYMPQLKEMLTKEFADIEGAEGIINTHVTSFELGNVELEITKSIEARYANEEEITPAENTPAEEKSTEEKSNEEKSNEEKSTEEKSIEEKTTEEKISPVEEEKTTEEKSTEEKKSTKEATITKVSVTPTREGIKTEVISEEKVNLTEEGTKAIEKIEGLGDISDLDGLGDIGALDGIEGLEGLGDIGGIDGLGDIGGIDGLGDIGDLDGLGDIGGLDGGFPEGLEAGGVETSEKDLSDMMTEFADEETNKTNF